MRVCTSPGYGVSLRVVLHPWIACCFSRLFTRVIRRGGSPIAESSCRVPGSPEASGRSGAVSHSGAVRGWAHDVDVLTLKHKDASLRSYE